MEPKHGGRDLDSQARILSRAWINKRCPHDERSDTGVVGHKAGIRLRHENFTPHTTAAAVKFDGEDGKGDGKSDFTQGPVRERQGSLSRKHKVCWLTQAPLSTPGAEDRERDLNPRHGGIDPLVPRKTRSIGMG